MCKPICPARTFLFLVLVSMTAGPAGGDVQRFAEMATESKRQGGTSLLVAENGKVVFTDFASGFTPDSRIPALSITKTLVALAGWQLQGRGWWSLQSPVGDFLSGWKGETARLVELLDFSAGLDGGRPVFYAKNVSHKRKLSHRQKPSPVWRGHFFYGPASYEVFGEALTKNMEANGENCPLTFLQKTIMNPIGASVASWRVDAEGTPFFSTGAWLSPRQMLALGELIRRDGRHGWRRVLPPGFLPALQKGAPGFPIYHLGVWRNLGAKRPGAHVINVEASIGAETSRQWWAGGILSSQAPPDLLALMGSGGQRIYIVPERKLVVVRTGRLHGKYFDDEEFLARLFPR